MIIGAEARRLVLVSAAYAVLTFLMAYPLSGSPGTTVVVDAPDTHVYIWTIAWDVYAFLHQPLRIFDANIYHPFPLTLAFSENLIGSAFFAAPFIWLTGNMVLGMNMAALVTCVLCGVGGYVLARSLQLRPGAAFLCGLVYAFAPPRFFKLGQLHTTAVQFIPFTMAFLHLYFDRGHRKYLRLAVGSFTLQALSSGHGAAFTAVAIVLLIAWRTLFGQPLAMRQWLRDFGVAGAYLIAPSIWMLLPYRIVKEQGGLRWGYTADALADADDFLASPTRLHTYLQREWLNTPTLNDTAIAFLFPGILVMIMAAIAIAVWRPRSREDWRMQPTGFYTLLGAATALMLAPPPLGIWRFVYWLPGFNFIRVPPRFILVTVMCLGVLLAAAFERMTRTASAATRTAAAAIVAALLLGEYFSYPFPAVPYSIEVPAADRWLDTQPKPFVVAEIPVPSRGNWGAHERMQSNAMLHATAHWQKTIHGYSSMRRPLHDRVYVELTAFPDRRSIDNLRELGVNYVVVHTDYYRSQDQWREVESRLPAFPELVLVHTDGPGRVYRLAR